MDRFLYLNLSPEWRFSLIEEVISYIGKNQILDEDTPIRKVFTSQIFEYPICLWWSKKYRRKWIKEIADLGPILDK